MIFHFIRAYSHLNSGSNFKMDIPVSFVIPDVFHSLSDLGVLGSNNKEVCDILTSMGVTHRVRHSYKVTKDGVIINIRNPEFDSIKKLLLRDQKLKELLG